MKGFRIIAAFVASMITSLFMATVGFAAVAPTVTAPGHTNFLTGIFFSLGAGAVGIVLNQGVLVNLYQSLRVLYLEGFQNATPLWPKLATYIPSMSKTEIFKFLANMAKMREWIGERELKNLSAHEFQIRNKDWELTIPVDRNDILFDQLGMYAPLLQMMGKSAAEHPDDLLIAVMLAGLTGAAYDGQNFFDTDHPRMDGRTVQSNLGTKKLSAGTYGLARAQMRGITDGRGRNMKVTPNLLVVSPQNEEVGKGILESQFLYNISADAVRVVSDNPYRGTAELLVINELSDYPDYWFLYDTTKPIKPFIFQEAKKPEFAALVDTKSEHVFNLKEYLYGVDSIDNVGYALWELAYMSEGSQAA